MGFSGLLYKLRRPATNRHTVEEPADLTVPQPQRCRDFLRELEQHQRPCGRGRVAAATKCTRCAARPLVTKATRVSPASVLRGAGRGRAGRVRFHAELAKAGKGRATELLCASAIAGAALHEERVAVVELGVGKPRQRLHTGVQLE